MRKFVCAGLWALGCFLFCTCQSLSSGLREPVLSLSSVDLTGVDFNGVDLVVRVNVENPNGFSIPLPRIEWEFFLDGSSFVSGNVKEDTIIKARKSTVMDVPLRLSYAGVFAAIRLAGSLAETPYRIVLRAAFPIPLIQEKVFTFEHSGDLPLLQAPKISVPSLGIERADFEGVEVLCKFNVDNPNAFPIPFPNVNWDYSVNNTSLLKNSLAGTGTLPAKASTPVEIKVDVSYSYLQLFDAIRSLANVSETPSLMNISADFLLPALENSAAALNIPGVLPLLRKPELRFAGISPRNISLQRAEFLITWEVENKNSFAMNIDLFDYDIEVNGVRWARGSIEAPPKLNPNKIATVPVLITLNSLDMIRELTTIMSRRGDVSYLCGGNMKLSGGLPGLEAVDMPFNFSGSTKLRN
jgi:LEA14-like dessication related protein